MNLSAASQPVCISNGGGSLLFYFHKDTIWNSQHLVMANGTGIAANVGGPTTKLALKKPGSNNEYYLFYLSYSTPQGLYFSIIDMGLAAGMGSVTAKNVPLYSGNFLTAISGVKHCNGQDFWLIMHEQNNNVFRSFLLSATGINSTAVVSTSGPTFTYSSSSMKINPQGTKLGLLNTTPPTTVSANFFDVDRSTGSVSNFFLGNTFGGNSQNGCEFSPDGSKFYFTELTLPQKVHQLNLCAGSASAVAASDYTLPGGGIGLSRASNGKIYYTRPGTSFLGVINNPNTLGTGMNLTDQGINMLPNDPGMYLPYFISSQTKEQFKSIQGLGCLTSLFNPPSVSNFSLASCWSSGNMVTGLIWNFGDPSSGPLNSSTLSAPSHTFSAFGTYTIKLVMSYSSCAADTMQQVISIVQASANVLTSSVACNSMASASVQVLGGSGNYSYTWTPSAQNGSVAYALSGGVYTLSVQDASFNCSQNFSTSINVPTLNIIAVVQSTPYCGFSNANVSVFNGSGNYSYQWLPGNQNSPSLNNLSAGNYTVLVFDPLNNCNLSSSLQVVPLALPVLSLSPSASICPGQSHTLTVAGADLYLWNTGSVSSSIVVSPVSTSYYSVSGTLSATGCSASKTTTIAVVPCVAIDELTMLQETSTIYPNPCTDWIYVHITTDMRLKLFNPLGKLVLETMLKSGQTQLNLEAFPQGLYLLTLNTVSDHKQVFRISKNSP
ncbi:MAG TPA: T9SS type A sorting domain-containing protein [Bacteroidia bacterium]|nr:T9SS type A sorting domain-containing protein [Bacteroidia bacterium]